MYESGNWGDFLKMLWVSEVVKWKQSIGINANYFDPFAGDVKYPLGKKTVFRLTESRLEGLRFIQGPFLDNGEWPSAASGAMLLVDGSVEVWDADPVRRGNWLQVEGVSVPEGESGWRLLEGRGPDPSGVWLIDPYDFMAEWREYLDLIAAKSRGTSLLLYIYNRSAKNQEAFADYRAFRNGLEDIRGDIPKRLGRVAADAFLPRSHHEMLFLPSEADCERDDLDAFLSRLGDVTRELASGLERCSVYDC